MESEVSVNGIFASGEQKRIRVVQNETRTRTKFLYNWHVRPAEEGGVSDEMVFPDQEKTDQNTWIYLKTTLPYNT